MAKRGRYLGFILAAQALLPAGLIATPSGVALPSGGWHFTAWGLIEGCGQEPHAASASVWIGNDGAYLIAAGDPALGGFVASGTPEAGFGAIMGGALCGTTMVQDYLGPDVISVSLEVLDCDVLGFGRVAVALHLANGGNLRFWSTANSGPENSICVHVDGVPAPINCEPLEPPLGLPALPSCAVTNTPCSPVMAGAATIVGTGQDASHAAFLSEIVCVFPPRSDKDSRKWFDVTWAFNEADSAENDVWHFHVDVPTGQDCDWLEGTHYQGVTVQDDTSNTNERAEALIRSTFEIEEFDSSKAIHTCLAALHARLHRWNGSSLELISEVREYTSITFVMPLF